MEARSPAAAVYLEAIIAAQAATIMRLEAVIREQDKRLRDQDSRDARIEELEALVRSLQMRGAQHSSTSSKPPSSDPPWVKSERKKKPKSGKPSGGQPGHRAHSRALAPSEDITETVHHVPEKCRHCDELLTGDDEVADALQRHQISELPPIKIIITEHQLHARACTSCGTITKAKLPEQERWLGKTGQGVKWISRSVRAKKSP
jgi:transposase